MKGIVCAVLLLIASMQVALAALDPQDMVIDVATRTIDRIKKDKDLIDKDPGRLYDLIHEVVLPHFDFERMSRWVLGKYWRKASPDEKKRFIGEFRTLLVRTYASSLADFAQQEITYLPFHGDLKSGEATVKSEVAQPGGFPIPINYRLYKPGAEWVVYDVTIDDISLVANYRTSFATEIRKSSIDSLIKTLAEKNAEASK